MVSMEILLPDVLPFLVSLWLCNIYCLLIFINTKFCIVAPIIRDEIEVRDPCYPSPCGPYSECRNFNGNPSCSCRVTYIGAPPNCRHECSISSECMSNKACIREKCIDPCPGSCGLNALCSVINHTPICTCPNQYIGDPFTSCRPAPPPRKLYIYSAGNIYSITTRLYFVYRKWSRSWRSLQSLTMWTECPMQ